MGLISPVQRATAAGTSQKTPWHFHSYWNPSEACCKFFYADNYMSCEPYIYLYIWRHLSANNLTTRQPQEVLKHSLTYVQFTKGQIILHRQRRRLSPPLTEQQRSVTLEYKSNHGYMQQQIQLPSNFILHPSSLQRTSSVQETIKLQIKKPTKQTKPRQ